MEEIEIVSDKSIADEFNRRTDKACLAVSMARSPILNQVDALMGDADLPTVNKAKLYLELNELASVVSKAKKIIRSHLELSGDEDYDVGSQICEVRLIDSIVLDSALWKKEDPLGYEMTKADYWKDSQRLSVKFRKKKGI